MRLLGRARRDEGEIWPGFVDALSGLLIIVLFVVMVFMVAQFFLTNQLSGQERAIERLNAAIAELAEALSLKQEEAEELAAERDTLRARLQATVSQLALLETEKAELEAEKAQLQSEMAALAEERAALAEQTAALAEEREELQAMVGGMEAEKEELEGRVAGLQASLGEQQEISEEAFAQVQLLNQQIAALRAQLAALQRALEAAEERITQQRLEIESLGERLNIALAAQVEELRQYRSEFFGRLRQVLGDRADIRIVGDRFVFQSELLFPTAEDELNPGGREQLAQLADELQQIAGEIPSDIEWILQVEGHTDKRPIQTDQFPSNWELSTARAIAVVRFLIAQGIPPHRLSANGYGEFQPIDDAETEDAYARNRRIELKFTQR